jgi:transcription elongation factor Elf1
MHWLDNKYINMVSSRLRNYKRKSGTLVNFSCNICGDSATNTRKARAYIYEKKGNTIFHCHNCGITKNFPNFLKTIDFQLYSDYNIELLKENRVVNKEKDDFEQFVAKMKTPLFIKDGPLKGLKKISQLPADHFCKEYVAGRQIPNLFHSKMFYCPKFFTWVNTFIPEKFSDESLLYDEPRLLIPFIKDDKMHAFQGRSLNKESSLRYITIVYDQEVSKIYGLDTVDYDKKVYVFEGPIDSMFVPNSIATAGGDLVSVVKDIPKKNLVVVYDNEPRSKETKQKIDKAVIDGYNVCVWPSNLEHKDVNDMILNGLSADFVRYIIDTNTYRDLKAKLALNMWSKA